MKNSKRFLGLATMLLTVTGMVACGGGSKQEASSGKCSHKYVTVAEESVEATCQAEGKKVEKCEKCGDKKETTVKKAAHKYEDVKAESKDATCTEAGKKVQKCANCPDKKETEIKALGHDMQPAADQTGATPATCTTPGERIMKCSRCEVTDKEEVQPLGHKWADSDDQSAAWAPTCVTSGNKIQKCTNAGCEETQKVEVAATGHKYGEPVQTAKAGDQVAYNKEVCSEDAAVRYSWSAGDVTAACKENPHNIAESGQGWQFWGQPKGNAVVLNESGNASSDAHEAVFDATVEGSYFEFKFNAPEDIKKAQLCADFTPAQYLNAEGGLFIAAPDGDWTPGMLAADKFIDDFRYEITVDGTKVELTKEDNEAAGGRKWYNFPLKNALDLAAGEHTIKITMTGGWKHTFYSFGLAVDGDHSDKGFKAEFKGLEHASLYEYLNNDYQKDPTNKAYFNNTGIIYSRSKSGGDFGAYAKAQTDEDGKTVAQWNFKIVPDAGYKVVSVIAENTGAYKNMKDPTGLGIEYSYSCTQVKGNTVFNVVIAAE